MENLHPAAQVTAIIMIGVVICVYLIIAASNFFDKK